MLQNVVPRVHGLRLVRRLIVLCCFLRVIESPIEIHAAARIEVEYADWGFDGRAAPRTFNLLTLGVQNPSDEPFEGTLRCRRLLSATGTWSGAELLQDIYVGPFSVRLVQFYPYMLDEGEVWEIRWGDGLEDTFLTERPQLTSGARVILNDPIANSGIQQGLKGFPEDWFPVTVTATDALRLVVMDHAPRWEATRRDVFRDWLFRGGILHVLQEPGGKYPHVPVPELNIEPRPTRFGAGRIYWHDRTRDQINKPYVYDTMYATSQDLVAVVDRDGSSFDIDPTSTEFIRRDEEFFEAYAEWDSDRLIPTRLKEFLRPNHEWPLIYLLAGVYLLALFPGVYLLVRSRIDYRYSLLALVVIVVGFSWLFSVMGARGYGESTSTTSVATARQLPDGRWDVEQWNSLFVTSGGDYALRAAGAFPITSTVESIERVSGVIRNGRDGRFSVDMPPFTYRTFATRTDLPLGKLNVVIASAELADQEAADIDEDNQDSRSLQEKSNILKSLQVKIDGILPSRVRDAVILFGDSFYPVNLEVLQAGSGNLVAGPGVRLIERINLSRQFQRFASSRMATPDDALDQFAPWLIARDLRLRRRMDIADFTLPPDEARLYVHADLPDELVCQNAADSEAGFGRHNGRIVYRIDLVVPEEPDR
ncbi:MAG: hypothetical protein HQ518_28555 [Rhodopirellula sp.]|nr:hypothetical protein [Rhodopirellula sp.]